jgi:hypothetical protein
MAATQYQTLTQYRDKINELIDQGYGDWQVCHKVYAAPVYTDIRLVPVTPGEGGADYEGLELDDAFDRSPTGRHILVDYDDSEFRT